MTLTARRGRVGRTRDGFTLRVCWCSTARAGEVLTGRHRGLDAVTAAPAVRARRVNSVRQNPYETLVSGEVAVRAGWRFRRARRPRVAEAAHRVRVWRRRGQRGPGGYDPAAQLRGQRPAHLAAADHRLRGRSLAPVGPVPPRPRREPA